MKWKEFYSIVATEETRKREAKKNIVLRSSTWIGRRIAYILYFTPITGNMISFLRIFMVFVATYLFSLIELKEYTFALLGIAIMALQMNADGWDGALARAKGDSSFFGDRVDNFGIDYAVVSLIIIIAYLTGSKIFILLSCFSVYIIVTFRQHVGLVIPHNIYMFFRIFFYTPIMCVFIPCIITLLTYMDVSIVIVSTVFTIFYLFLSIMWLIVCSWIHLVSKNKDEHNKIYGKR